MSVVAARFVATPAAMPVRMASSSSVAGQPPAPSAAAAVCAAAMSMVRPASVAWAQAVPADQHAAPSTLAGACAA